jgi:Fe2+ transport system protein FeoA
VIVERARMARDELREEAPPPHSLDLAALEDGARAIVVSFDCEPREARRLEAMGLRVGSSLVKKSSALGGGPVVVEGECGPQLALGHALAARVIVARA